MTGRIVLSILIPAWDEEDAIAGVVSKALAACARHGIAAESLVCVDSRTQDATGDRARAAGATVAVQRSHGLTAAVLELADLAAGTVCAVLDGDGQHDGAAVVRLAAPVLASDADLVTGARESSSLRSGFGTGWRGAARRVGARLLGGAARLAVRRGVPDPLTGMFACRRADLQALRHRAQIAPPGGFKLLLGLLVTTPRDRIRHVTVPFLPRRDGASKLGVRVVASTLRQLLWLMILRRVVRNS